MDPTDWGLPEIEPAQLGAGLLVLLVGFAVGLLAQFVLQRYWKWRRRSPSFASVFATLAKWTAVIIAAGAALTVAFPSVEPVNVLGGLGIVSIAAGIAFQQVLGNLFAGVILLTREPFRGGDQVAIGDVRGTIVRTNLRETEIRTFDGRRVIIPNSVIHDGVITVQTGYEKVRTSVDIGVAYGTDLEVARDLAVRTMTDVPGVVADPAPQALVTGLGAITIDIELRFWSGALRLETLETRDRVIQAILREFDAAGIEMPSPTSAVVVREAESGD
ncbi:MAG: mechanosensitive ion channel [Actinobacteria bacterium]|nr:mechanosensitive ion channel [Actinomycetota bacterium]